MRLSLPPSSRPIFFFIFPRMFVLARSCFLSSSFSTWVIKVTHFYCCGARFPSFRTWTMKWDWKTTVPNIHDTSFVTDVLSKNAVPSAVLNMFPTIPVLYWKDFPILAYLPAQVRLMNRGNSKRKENFGFYFQQKKYGVGNLAREKKNGKIGIIDREEIESRV